MKKLRGCFQPRFNLTKGLPSECKKIGFSDKDENQQRWTASITMTSQTLPDDFEIFLFIGSKRREKTLELQVCLRPNWAKMFHT